MIRVMETPGEVLRDVPAVPIEIDGTMLTNVPKGGARQPIGEPFEYYLFGTERRAHGVERRVLFVISGKDEDACGAQLLNLLDTHANLHLADVCEHCE